MTHPPDAAFEALLEFLKRTRGIDFTGYKRTSLQRRVRRRMEAVGCDSFGDYLDLLEVTPHEYEALFEMLLINVTEFFRDPAAWEHLREEVLPALMAAKAAGRARARLERRLRERPGGVHGRDRVGGAARAGRVPRAREDLRDRHRRRRAEPGTVGGLHRQGGRVGRAGVARALLRACRSAARVSQGPAAHGHLRSQQPRAGRADLAPGPADLPQHTDVLQRGDAERDPAPLPLRAQRGRRVDARQIGDDDLAPRAVRRLRPQQAGVPQATARQHHPADVRAGARRAPEQ